MITEVFKRVELIREIENFEAVHETVLRDFRREQKFPVPKENLGVMQRWELLKRVFK